MTEYVAPPADHPPEEWRPIKGYEGRYDISNHGRVRSWVMGGTVSMRRGVAKVLAPQSSESPAEYQHVALRKDGATETFRLHVLVLKNFVGPTPDGCEGAHEDGRPSHNWLGNLAWKTHAENNADKKRHGTHRAGHEIPSSKLTEDQAIEIKYSTAKRKLQDVADQYGVSAATVSLIRNDKIWRHI